MPKIDVAFLLANSENQIEKFAAMYKNLQPKKVESLSFLPPNFELLQDIRSQGEIVVNCRNAAGFQPSTAPNGSNSAQSHTTTSSMLHRQAPRATNSPNNGDQMWDSATETAGAAGLSLTSQVTSAKTYASIVKPSTSPVVGQCIPGSEGKVMVNPAITPSEKFYKFLRELTIQTSAFAIFQASHSASTGTKMAMFPGPGVFASTRTMKSSSLIVATTEFKCFSRTALSSSSLASKELAMVNSTCRPELHVMQTTESSW